MVNDDSASSATDHSYTDQQVTAEAAARTSADTAEASTSNTKSLEPPAPRPVSQRASITKSRGDCGGSIRELRSHGRDAAEATARVTGDIAAVASANSYTDGAVTTINSSLATKANLTGGNIFAGNQTVNGSLSLPATRCRTIRLAGL